MLYLDPEILGSEYRILAELHAHILKLIESVYGMGVHTIVHLTQGIAASESVKDHFSELHNSSGNICSKGSNF